MDYLVSIIVPVYNVETYVGKCLESLMAQTYKNIEILVIDDGSTDNSGIICDRYMKKNEKIRVIHQSNAGLSAARNIGLDYCRGDFIMFVDSDDFVHPEMCEILIDNIERYDGDICLAKFQRIGEGKAVKEYYIDEQYSVEVFSKKQIFEKLLDANFGVYVATAWGKLYRRKLFTNLRYEVGRLHEDEFIIHKILDKVDKAVCLDVKLYYYLQRSDSIMGRKFNVKRLDALDALEDRIEYFEKNEEYDLLYTQAIKYLEFCIAQYVKINETCKNERNAKKRIKSGFRSVYKNYVKGKTHMARQIRYVCFIISFPIYKIVTNIYEGK